MGSRGATSPDLDAFRGLVRDHVLVPVWREVLADLATPLAVYDRVRTAERERGVDGTFLLESVERGERWGRHSFIGLRPLATLSWRGGVVRVDGELPPDVAAAALDGAGAQDPLAALAQLRAALRTPALDGLPPLHAGAVGYLGWDVARAIERLPAAAVDDLGLDDVRMVVPGTVIAFDHLRQVMTVVDNVLVDGDVDAAHAAATARIDALVDRLGAPLASPPLAPPRTTHVTDAASDVTREQFLAAVEAAQEHIRAGDAFQVVLSQRFALPTDVDPLLVHRVLRVINPSPYMFVFDWDDLQLVGSSPEALLTVRAGEARIWPIAGSRPRGADPEADDRLEAELRADAKEVAEHVMLVDLARNDLGRVCELGTVRVAELMDVVRYSHVMHLESRVRGQVRAGQHAVDVVRATFPAGTLSGAPKVRALEIIDALEPHRRGPYGGGIGYLDLAGDVDLCIAIRTLVFSGGTAYVQAGAGIVADSVPAAEYDESVSKSMALLSAVRAAEALAADGSGTR